MDKKPSFYFLAAPLFLVIFIDGMGMGLVIPMLNALIVDTQSGFFTHALSPAMHNFIYGLVIASYMFCWFFGSSILGDLSDRLGRKKSLLICMSGAVLSYLISAIAIPLHSISILLLGRVIGGLTAGSQPIAQAAIVDLSEPEHIARNLGFILLALSLGFIVGPLCGGVLSNSALVPWFSFATPFYYAAIFSLINVILLWWLFKDVEQVLRPKKAFNPYHAIEIFISAFKHIEVRNISIVYFVFVFGWSSYYSFVAMFLLDNYNFSPMRVSIFMAIMGIGFGIGNGILVEFFTGRFSLKNNFACSCLLSAVLIFLMVSIKQAWVSWVGVIPLACCVAIAFASALTLFSNQVSRERQGWVMGITCSIMAFVWAVNSVVVGLLASWSTQLPIFVAAISLLLVTGMTFILIKRKVV